MATRLSRRIGTAFLFLAAACIYNRATEALEFRPWDLHEASRFVDAIATAQIRSGAMANPPCGGSYEAKVSSVLKGDLKTGQSIKLVGRHQYKIGATYLLFLTRDDKWMDYIHYPTGPSDPQHACKRELKPDFFEGLQTAGPFVITHDHEVKLVVLFPEIEVTIPPEIYKEIYEPGVWAVSLERVERVIEGWGKE